MASTAYVYADQGATCRGRNPCCAQSPGFFALASVLVARLGHRVSDRDPHSQPSRIGKRPRPGRSTERAAIRAARGLFEDEQMPVQEVDTANDIGKDLYVDLIDEGVFTGELVALQVKGGASYRAISGAHRIRTTAHDRLLWANSPVPVFGIVHDPGDDALYWANLTAWSRAQGAVPETLAVTMSTWALTPRTLGDFLAEARSFLAASGPPALLGLADEDVDLQIQAIRDAFALGRRDPRPLLLVRRSILYLADEALAQAVRVLTLALPRAHGDIWWTPHNWIDPEVRARMSSELSQWNLQEAIRLLSFPDGDEWTRGGLGQDIAALVGSGWGPDVTRLLEDVAMRASLDAAWPALMLLVDAAGDDGPEVFDSVVPQSAALRTSTVVKELGSVLAEHGSACLW